MRELAGVRSSGKGPMPHLDLRVRGEFSSGKAQCHRDLPRLWHRGFLDEREAKGAGGGPEDFGGCESSRAFGHRAKARCHTWI